MLSLKFLPVEIHQQIALHLLNGKALDVQNLSHLEQTCRFLHNICQPLVYRKVDLDHARPHLLGAAYTLCTKPKLAREVRFLRLPRLTRSASRDAPKHEESLNHPAWPAHADMSVMHDQIVAALPHQSTLAIDECSRSVKNGTRKDLIAMLILINTPNLRDLELGAMGPYGDYAATRAMFQYAVSRLIQLKNIRFAEPGEKNAAYSFNLFADFWKLPSIDTIRAESIATGMMFEVPGDLNSYFSFILDIDAENLSLG